MSHLAFVAGAVLYQDRSHDYMPQGDALVRAMRRIRPYLARLQATGVLPAGATLPVVFRFGDDGPATCVAISPAGRLVAGGGPAACLAQVCLAFAGAVRPAGVVFWPQPDAADADAIGALATPAGYENLRGVQHAGDDISATYAKTFAALRTNLEYIRAKVHDRRAEAEAVAAAAAASNNA